MTALPWRERPFGWQAPMRRFRSLGRLTETKRPPDRPTVLSLAVGVDALDFALALLTLPLWDWSLLGAGRCENLIRSNPTI